ncbi:MAG: hypothetical protein J0L63_20585 [Anaerolineae bacterium]|nr:hypothetical protein [Anaerolineae bacterium]
MTAHHHSPLKALVAISLLILLAACETIIPPPTLTPTIELSGPTIAPSPTVNASFTTSIPFDDLDLGAGASDATAAALAPFSAMPPLIVGTANPSSGGTAITITALDDTFLPGLFYQIEDGVRRPGVLLLGSNINEWGDFPIRLQAAGFTVLIMTVRPDQALLDFTVMLQALATGEADPASLAVIGAGAGADTALLGCAGELLCDTAILLSPSANPALLEAINAYNPRPLMMVASENDTASFAAVQALQAAVSGEVLVQPFASAGTGTEMLLNRPDLGDLMIQWLLRTIGS